LQRICEEKEWNLSFVMEFQESVTWTRTFINLSAFAERTERRRKPDV